VQNLGNFDFTADIVKVNGGAVSKVGRSQKPNALLKQLTLSGQRPTSTSDHMLKIFSLL
jgi:hypothetical protein